MLQDPSSLSWLQDLVDILPHWHALPGPQASAAENQSSPPVSMMMRSTSWGERALPRQAPVCRAVTAAALRSCTLSAKVNSLRNAVVGSFPESHAFLACSAGCRGGARGALLVQLWGSRARRTLLSSQQMLQSCGPRSSWFHSLKPLSSRQQYSPSLTLTELHHVSTSDCTVSTESTKQATHLARSQACCTRQCACCCYCAVCWL